MPSYYQDKLTFMKVAELYHRTSPAVGWVSPEQQQAMRLALKLIAEELWEFQEAPANTVEEASELIDLITVLLQYAAVMGYPIDEMWSAIHQANIRKVAGGVRRRKDGKILKPVGWQPADIASIFSEAIQRGANNGGSQ